MITISDIEAIEQKIKVAKERSQQYVAITRETTFENEDFNAGDVTIPEFFSFLKDSSTVKSILSNHDTPESIRHSLTILTKKIPDISDLVDNAVSEANEVLSGISDDIIQLEKDLESAIEQYCYENDFHLDYYLKVGKPHNPNGEIYTKEDLESVVSELITLLKNQGIDLYLGERNKIYLPSVHLMKEKAVDFVFDLIKSNEIVNSKFNGKQFKTCLQVNEYKVGSSHSIKLFQKQ